MAYYILGTSLIDGNEETTWANVCSKGFGVDSGHTEMAFKIFVRKLCNIVLRWRRKNSGVQMWML